MLFDPTTTRTRYWNLLLQSIVASAFCLRLILLLISSGSDDYVLWRMHGQLLWDHGFAGGYATTESLNHPPLPYLWAGAAFWLSTQSLRFTFPIFFKLPVFAADVLGAFILKRAWQRQGGNGWAAAALWALSPTSALIGEYHCNTDSIMAVLILLAAYLLMSGRAGWGGLALAAAGNIKIPPLLLMPLLASACRDRGALIRYCAGFVVGLLPFVVGYAFAGPPMLRNIFGYRGFVNEWGILVILLEAQKSAAWGEWAASAYAWYASNGRYFILGSVALLTFAAWVWRSRWNPYQLAAIALASMLVLSPAFAMQYAVFPLAVMMAANLRRGAAYGLIAGTCLLIIYIGFSTGALPLESSFQYDWPPPARLIGLLAWGSLCGFALQTAFVPSPSRRRPAEVELAR